ncbi:MAG: hypothetical protein HY260_11935 [Chloroflexi bacterium]|nr:hypothetical protein [Chloroflexota bacterium]
MAQYCPKCKWYSADGLTHCSTCGAPFEEEIEDEDEDEAEAPSLVERVGWGLAISVAAVVGGIALYGRYGSAERLGAVGSTISRIAGGLKEFARAAYDWLIGPKGEYKDFISIALVGSLVVWIVLWVLARMGRR